MNKIISIFTIFLSLIFAQISSVHLMEIVYNKGGDIKVKNPEVVQAYYDQLGGDPRNYLINSKTDFDLYINLLVPASSNYNGRYSAKVFSVKDGKDQELAFIDGQTNFEWQEFYDPSIRDYYFKGPEIEKQLPPGDYKITVFNYENRDKYVLAIGKNQEFSWLNLMRAYLILPTLKTEFFKTSVLQFFLTPFGLVLIGSAIILLLIIAFFILVGFFAEKLKNRGVKTILLTSAGMQMRDEITKLLQKPAYNTNVAFVTTASKPQQDKSYVKADREIMREVGFNIEEVDIEGKNMGQLMKIFQPKDIIFVEGGNTFYLMKAIRQSGFDKAIKKLLKQGKVYIGVSAGSIVAGKKIKTAEWLGDEYENKEKFNFKNFKGMALVPFNIFVHYQPEYAEIIKKKIKSDRKRKKLRILTDDQAILIQGREVALIGKGEKIIL